MKLDVTIEGEKEILRKMKALPGKMERKIYRAAVNRASTPVLKRARALSSSKTVRKALTKRPFNRAQNGVFDINIGVRSDVFRSRRVARRKGRGAEYFPDEAIRFFRFLELGTKHHPAKQFLRPAIHSQRHFAKIKLSDEIDKGLGKVVNAGL